MNREGDKNRRPNVGTGIFVIRDNKILLGRRIGLHGKDTWGLTGGHLEFGESFEDCARRETYEEAGIQIKNVRLATVTNDIIHDKHYITLFLISEYCSGEAKIMEPDKFDVWDWFSWSELPGPLFLPLDNLKNSGFDPFNAYESNT